MINIYVISLMGGQIKSYLQVCYMIVITGPNGAVVMSLANGLVGTGFAPRHRLQPRVGILRPNG